MFVELKLSKVNLSYGSFDHFNLLPHCDFNKAIIKIDFFFFIITQEIIR